MKTKQKIQFPQRAHHRAIPQKSECIISIKTPIFYEGAAFEARCTDVLQRDRGHSATNQSDTRLSISKGIHILKIMTAACITTFHGTILTVS